MAHHASSSSVSPASLETAQRGWKNFTRASFAGVVGVTALLLLLLGISALNGWV